MYKEIQIKECDLNKQQEKIKKLMEEKKDVDARKVIKNNQHNEVLRREEYG